MLKHKVSKYFSLNNSRFNYFAVHIFCLVPVVYVFIEFVIYFYLNCVPILDATKQLFMSGNMFESKKAKFNIWRTENNVIIPDVGFSLSLNHSRLLSSSLEWRIDLKDNIVVTNILLTINTNILYYYDYIGYTCSQMRTSKRKLLI